MATKRKARRKPAAAKPETLEAWQASRSERETRIEVIVDRMMQGAWLTGVSDKAFAKEWNLSPNTIRKMAAEASRMVRYQIRTDPEAQAEARARLIQLFEVIGAKAMGMGDAQGLRVALDAARAYGFYMGVEPAKRLSVESDAGPFEGWTTEEKLAFAKDGKRPKRAVGRLGPLLTEGEPVGSYGDDDGEPVH